jgi:anthranilate/para-aminobenzoate synthase component I
MGDGTWSYLGVAEEVRVAERGREREFLTELRAVADRDPEVRGFFGGWVVALGYELGVALLGLDPAPDDAAPALALRIDTVLAIHEAEGTAELRGVSDEAIEVWLHRFGSLFGIAEPGATTAGATSAVVWRQSSEAYRRQVRESVSHIHDGDAYVLCLTDTATMRGEFDPLDLYLTLRAESRAVRGGVLVAGDRALVSVSPERFVSVRDATVSTHPIKGTRRRGAQSEEDAALASELATDAKELAENLMIVDLMRNDLSRVCAPGSVRVDGFLRVESHAHVHQLVSTVTGQLRPGKGVVDAVEACFPGGSMTGAPKRRAVEILSSLETEPRGLYSGCFGWIDRGGDAELAMSIRGIELRGREQTQNRFVEARVGAGGGITADSDAEAELSEKQLKASPLIAALIASHCDSRQ